MSLRDTKHYMSSSQGLASCSGLVLRKLEYGIQQSGGTKPLIIGISGFVSGEVWRNSSIIRAAVSSAVTP